MSAAYAEDSRPASSEILDSSMVGWWWNDRGQVPGALGCRRCQGRSVAEPCRDAARLAGDHEARTLVPPPNLSAASAHSASEDPDLEDDAIIVFPYLQCHVSFDGFRCSHGHDLPQLGRHHSQSCIEPQRYHYRSKVAVCVE